MGSGGCILGVLFLKAHSTVCIVTVVYLGIMGQSSERGWRRDSLRRLQDQRKISEGGTEESTIFQWVNAGVRPCLSTIMPTQMAKIAPNYSGKYKV